MVFSPPSVCALKTSVARYLSGSRAARVDGAGAVLAFTAATLAFTFVLTFMLTFVSFAGPRVHPLSISAVADRARTKQKTRGLTITTLGRASAVFIGHSLKEIRAQARKVETRGFRGKDHSIADPYPPV